MGGKARDSTGRVVPPVDFLGRLQEADRVDLGAIAREVILRRGQPAFRAGDSGRNVFFLRQGRVKISQRSGGGREVILWFCSGGEIFGMAEATRGGGRAVNADACEDSLLWTVSSHSFREFIASHPQAALLAMEAFAVRLRDLSETVVNIVSDDVPLRVAKLILRLGVRYGMRGNEGVQVAIPFTHQEIADMTGTTRQSVTSVLSDLRRAGVLEVAHHRILIASERGLQSLAAARAPAGG